MDKITAQFGQKINNNLKNRLTRTSINIKIATKQYVVSQKMEDLFTNVANIDGCQYIYVTETPRHGGHPSLLDLVVQWLIDKEGYSLVDPSKNANEDHVTDYMTNPGLRVLPIQKKGSLKYNGREIIQFEDTSDDAKRFFKSKKNSKGEYIKVVVGTLYEGLDLSYLQAVHIVTPLATMLQDDQAVGRALRMCGHEQNRKDVYVYRYFSTPPDTMGDVFNKLTPAKKKSILAAMDRLKEFNLQGVDVHVYKDALRRGTPMQQFLKCVQGQSIECEINGKNRKGKNGRRQRGSGLLEVMQAASVPCGKPTCDVPMDENYKLIIPKHIKPKHLRQSVRSTNESFMYVDNRIHVIPTSNNVPKRSNTSFLMNVSNGSRQTVTSPAGSQIKTSNKSKGSNASKRSNPMDLSGSVSKRS
jgi:hypothetical protein